MFVNRDKCFLSSSRIWTNPLRLFFLEQKSRKFIRINIYETDYDLEISCTYVRWTKTIIVFIFSSKVKWLKEFREIRSFSRSSISRIFPAIYIERQKMAKPSVYPNWLAILSPTFIAIVSRKPTQWFLSMGNLFDDRVDFFPPAPNLNLLVVQSRIIVPIKERENSKIKFKRGYLNYCMANSWKNRWKVWFNDRNIGCIKNKGKEGKYYG